MLTVICHLNYLAVGVVSLIGFAFGSIWYSPVLFSKAWMAEVKFTKESWEASAPSMPKIMGGAFLLTALSTFTLAVLVADHRSAGAARGAALGLFVGAGLIAARSATNAIFERKSLRHFLIVSGYDVALCALQGAILGIWR